MNTWVKICGITRSRDALLAAEFGASALGFVFHASSPRRCDHKTACNIIAQIPPDVRSVGVWLDEDASQIADEARAAGCQKIQNYSLDVSARLRDDGFDLLPAIPAAGAADNPGEIARSLEQLKILGFSEVILDTSRGHTPRPHAGAAPLKSNPGDFTTTFDFARELGIQVIYAGVLNPSNVATIVERYSPYGVDVASGVESAPGIKDQQLLARFFKEVQSCN